MAQIVVRLTLSSNSIGPYSIYVDSLDSTPVAVGITRDQLIAGYNLELPSHDGGVEYTILIQNNQVGCEDVIERTVILYDETPAPTPSPSKTPGPTPSTTPSNTPDVSSTPQATPTTTPTSTPEQSITPTPTGTPPNSVTPTPTPSQNITSMKGLLLVEPQTSGEDVLNYLLNRGVTPGDFLGFTFTYSPQTTDSLKYYMEMFAYDGVSGLKWYEIDIPQSGPNQYLFDEIIIPSGTISERAWYTFFIPDDAIGGTENRMTQIEQGTTSAYGNVVYMESTVFNFGPIYYEGQVFENKNYRVYTSWLDQALRLDNTTDSLYFKGKQIS